MANHISITGNLTRDPELRFTSAGRAVCNIGIADDYRFQRNGEWVSETTFHNLTIWGEVGENAAASLNKGETVIITGRLQSRSYEGQDGEKKVAWDVVVDSIGPSLRWVTTASTKVNKTPSSGASRPAAASARYEEEPPF